MEIIGNLAAIVVILIGIVTVGYGWWLRAQQFYDRHVTTADIDTGVPNYQPSNAPSELIMIGGAIVVALGGKWF